MAEGEDVAGSLIAALGREGEYIDEGKFTLDATKAQAKLRDYQLSNPWAYVLLLVEAAWVGTRERGPGLRARIEFETGRKTVATFDSPVVPKQALANLFGAALGDSSGLGDDPVRIRVLQLVGLAANNALALEPSALWVEAVDPEGKILRATLTTEGVEVETTDDDAEAPELRFGLEGAWLSSGDETSFSRPERERALLRERCAHSSFEIRVDGDRVSRGPRASFDDEGEREPITLAGEPIGSLGFDPEFGIAKLVMVNRGVATDFIRLDAPEGLLAVVEVDLPMDLSRSQVLDGKELREVKRAVSAAIRRLPQDNRPINWSAVQTGDGYIVAFFVGFALAFVLLALLVFEFVARLL